MFKRFSLLGAVLLLPVFLAGDLPDGTKVAAIATTTDALSQKTYEALSAAQTLITPESGTGNPRKAIADLKALLSRGGLNSNEIAHTWNLIAYAQYTLEDQPAAIQAYERVLEQDISKQLELTTLKLLFQLNFAEEDYGRSLEYLNQWEAKTPKLEASIVFLKSHAYYQLKDYQQALDASRQGESIVHAESGLMEENWLVLQVALYYELKDTTNTISVLERLLRRFPKSSYWIQLAGNYIAADENRRALHTYYAAYQQGLFEKEREFITLSQLLMNDGLPFEAARILDEGIAGGDVKKNEENLRLLAMAYDMADNYPEAITAWRAVAEVSDGGEAWSRAGFILEKLARYQEAAAAFQKALDVGNLKNPDRVILSLGISLTMLKQWEPAKEAFVKLADKPEFEETVAKWQKYIVDENERILELMEKLSANAASYTDA